MIADRRGVSTTVDVGLCLLLVGASMMTLVTVADDRASVDGEPTDADHTAETVATTTLSVNYSLRPAVESDDTGAFDGLDSTDEALSRVAHGPSAGLLADAAVANVSVDGEGLAREGDAFERAVDEALRRELAGPVDDVHVVAVWRPYRNASIEGRAVAGTEPPPNADVEGVTLTVPSRMAAVRAEAVDAARSGDASDVSLVVADAVVDGLFPPAESHRTLESEGVERSLLVARYERAAAALDVEFGDGDEYELSRRVANATAANAKLTAALATDLGADLDSTYDSPAAAARAVSTGEVTLVVRTWNA